jgi:hypothetical protein
MANKLKKKKEIYRYSNTITNGINYLRIDETIVTPTSGVAEQK